MRIALLGQAAFAEKALAALVDHGDEIVHVFAPPDSVAGKVLRLAGFGAFVELVEGVEGLCHFSEVPGWSGRKSDPAPLTPGQEMDFKIIKMNEAERKIGLSLKAFVEAGERSRLDEYQKRAAAASSILEDYLPRRDPR